MERGFYAVVVICMAVFMSEVQQSGQTRGHVTGTDQLLSSLQQLITKSGIDLQKKMDDKLKQLKKNLQDSISFFEDKIEDRISQLQTDFLDRTVSLEEKIELNQNNRVNVKNQTDTISEMLTSGEVKVTCMTPVCHRYMDRPRSTPYPPYIITFDAFLNRNVFCDTKTQGGGWIVIQRRTGPDVDFYRDWADYKNGFGKAPGNFWLGNEAIHNLTVRHHYRLRVDMLVKDQELFAEYTSFGIEDESDNYRLRLGSYSGTVGGFPGFDLSYHNNMQFSTRDRDNDLDPRNCASHLHGAWWYQYCYLANLNGLWGVQTRKGISWDTGFGSLYPTFVEMKIRKV